MGKILNALETADGDIRDLVMQCLEDTLEPVPEQAPETHVPSRRATVSVLEPVHEEPPLVRLPQRAEHQDAEGEEAWPKLSALAPTATLPGASHPATHRQISLRISDASPLLSPKQEDRRAAEQYRIIRTKIFHQLPGPSVTVIASPGMGDGKTVTAVNLAASLAHKTEDKVILVDADLRLSKVHERLGIPKAPGLADVLAGECELEEAMVQVEQLPNFYILPAGEARTNPTELLDSSQWGKLLSRLREEFRRTIIDSPPVEAVADYDLIAANCDGVVLVVRPDYTSRPLLDRALAKVKGKLTGVLINNVEDWFLWRRVSPSYHYYQGGAERHGRAKAAKP